VVKQTFFFVFWPAGGKHFFFLSFIPFFIFFSFPGNFSERFFSFLVFFYQKCTTKKRMPLPFAVPEPWREDIYTALWNLQYIYFPQTFNCMVENTAMYHLIQVVATLPQGILYTSEDMVDIVNEYFWLTGQEGRIGGGQRK